MREVIWRGAKTYVGTVTLVPGKPTPVPETEANRLKADFGALIELVPTSAERQVETPPRDRMRKGPGGKRRKEP